MKKIILLLTALIVSTVSFCQCTVYNLAYVGPRNGDELRQVLEASQNTTLNHFQLTLGSLWLHIWPLIIM